VSAHARLVSAVPSVTRCVGSRIHGTAKPWSDLDLAIKAKSALDWKLLEDIKEAFQESELPFRVDVLDWNEITDAFRRAIKTKGYEILG
jgi:predicted nucleotidyltransferase